MQSPRAALIGIDWGTTHRRAVALDAAGTCIGQADDDQGLVAASGRFEASLPALLDRLPPLADDAPVVLSGMVGSARGWREVPYLDSGVPLAALGRHLTAVEAPSLARHRCLIVPGVR